MSPDLIIATVSILIAAIIYTIAVFSEIRAHGLKPIHIVLFWTGLVFDTIGTTLMSKIAGGLQLDVHGILGAAAIVLMLIHAVVATWTIASRNTKLAARFKSFSLTVWTLWMVSLVSGMALALPAMFG